jgi:hypothetical protein
MTHKIEDFVKHKIVSCHTKYKQILRRTNLKMKAKAKINFSFCVCTR